MCNMYAVFGNTVSTSDVMMSARTVTSIAGCSSRASAAAAAAVTPSSFGRTDGSR